MSDEARDEPKQFGPYSPSQTDADSGIRLYIPREVLEESGLDEDVAVLYQPYENGIHVVKAVNALTDSSVAAGSSPGGAEDAE